MLKAVVVFTLFTSLLFNGRGDVDLSVLKGRLSVLLSGFSSVNLGANLKETVFWENNSGLEYERSRTDRIDNDRRHSIVFFLAI